ncbi:LCP family protein [Candidatus Peregrinibacteria bacterium]|jgi:polyisoprenyl-teichoic acid--peptidoglycan teichoic acid transferase|nr:LCP family protein [Candidatus Peregrinibacteria bacterium]
MTFTVRKINDKPRGRKVWLTRLAAILTIVQPLLQIAGRLKEHVDGEKKKRARVSILKRSLLIMIAVLISLMLLASIGKAMMSVRNLGITNIISIAGADLPKDNNGYTNFLLMGQGHADHDGKNLTDTIMVASVDPKGTKSTVLLSLPRDLHLLNTERMGKGKLNTMYRDFRSYLIYQKGLEPEVASIDALQEIANELSRKLGINIHHTVKVDFIAFTRAVDTLGGIDIDVPYDINDQEYPNETFGYEPFVIKAGPRHLDGETALKYARSRHTTSDFGRSARQQQVLGTMAHTAKETGVLKDPAAITSFMKIMSENVETTMTLRELIGAAEIAQKLDRDSIVAMQLNDRNALYDYIIEPGGFLYTPPRSLFKGASVLLPVSIPEFPVTWRQPKAFAELIFRNRELYLDRPVISILNAGGPPGTARKLGTELKRYGFTVSTIENAETEKIDASMIIGAVEPDEIVKKVGKMLGMPLKPSPSDLPASQKERITIILGRDYRYTPLQNLIKNLLSNPTP